MHYRNLGNGRFFFSHKFLGKTDMLNVYSKMGVAVFLLWAELTARNWRKKGVEIFLAGHGVEGVAFFGLVVTTYELGACFWIITAL